MGEWDKPCQDSTILTHTIIYISYASILLHVDVTLGLRRPGENVCYVIIRIHKRFVGEY